MVAAYFTYWERRKADRVLVNMPEEKTRQEKQRDW